MPPLAKGECHDSSQMMGLRDHFSRGEGGGNVVLCSCYQEVKSWWEKEEDTHSLSPACKCKSRSQAESSASRLWLGARH